MIIYRIFISLSLLCSVFLLDGCMEADGAVIGAPGITTEAITVNHYLEKGRESLELISENLNTKQMHVLGFMIIKVMFLKIVQYFFTE